MKPSPAVILFFFLISALPATAAPVAIASLAPFEIEKEERWPVEISRPDTHLLVVVNIPERMVRIYHVTDTTVPPGNFHQPVETFPVAIGTRKFRTPTFKGTVRSKKRKPDWYAPKEDWAGEFAGTIVPFDSPVNPFRARNSRGRVEGFFISIGGDGIGLHSTSDQRSIGKMASHGCIRMRLEDVKHLFSLLPSGTPVHVVYEIFRLEKTGAGLAVLGIEDVYRRYRPEEKIDLLASHLSRHGYAITALKEEEVKKLVSGKGVEIVETRLVAGPWKASGEILKKR